MAIIYQPIFCGLSSKWYIHSLISLVMITGFGIKLTIEIGFTYKFSTLDFDFVYTPCWISCFDSVATKEYFL